MKPFRTLAETIVGKKAEVHVAELLPEMVEWNRQFLMKINGALLNDRRARVFSEDVFVSSGARRRRVTTPFFSMSITDPLRLCGRGTRKSIVGTDSTVSTAPRSPSSSRARSTR